MPKAHPTGSMLQAWGIYREILRKYHSTVDLAGLAPDDEPLALREIYVPLRLTTTPHDEGFSERSPRDRGLFLLDSLGKLYVRPTDRFPEISNHHKPVGPLFLSGEAGSGKTTLIRSIVNDLTGQAATGLGHRFEGFVPFPLILRDAPLKSLNSLEALVDWSLTEARQDDRRLEIAPLKGYLDRNWGVILLDGLDEVGSLQARQRVLEWLRDSPWVGDANLVIVTARPSGFDGLLQDIAQAQAVHLHVAPFSDEQIRDYLDRWFRLRPKSGTQRSMVVRELADRLTADSEASRLRPMARRPAYLAALALVHGTRGALPHSRAALYELLVDAYVDMLAKIRGLEQQRLQLNLPTWDRTEKIEILSAVASQAHIGATSQEESDSSDDRRFFFSKDQLETAIRKAINFYGEDRFRTVEQSHAEQLAQYFVARTGLLVERRENQYQFAHLSLQEYLTALFLLNQATAADDKARSLAGSLFSRLDGPGWQEVAVLALAIDSDRTGGGGHRATLAELDLGRPSHCALLGRVLAGEELRFSRAERHDLLLACAAGCVRNEDWATLRDVSFQTLNAEGLRTVWRQACAWIAAGETSSFAEALTPALQGTAPASDVPADPLATLSRSTVPKPQHETSSGIRLIRNLASTRRHGETVDSLLVIPWTLSTEPARTESLEAHSLEARSLEAHSLEAHALEAVIATLPSVWSLDRDGLPDVPARWFWLEPWAWNDAALAASILSATPLVGWLMHDRLSRMAEREATKLTPIARWRARTWRRLRQSGRWLLATEPTWALHLERELTLTLDRVRGRTVDHAQDPTRALERARFMVQLVDRNPAGATKRALDLAWDLAKDRDLPRALDRASALAVELAQEASPEFHGPLVAQKDHLISLRNALLHKKIWPNALRELVANLRHVGTAYFGLTQGASIEGHASPTGEAILSELEALHDVGRMTCTLEDSARRAHARAEWRQVLESSYSPIPRLETLLVSMRSNGLEQLDSSERASVSAADRAIGTMRRIVGQATTF